MKVSCNAETDILTVVLRDAPVAESDEDKPGVILDYDAQGNLVSIELLDASRKVEDPVPARARPRPRRLSRPLLWL